MTHSDYPKASDCPKCTSGATTNHADGPAHSCKDCGHEWDGEHSAYDAEPELQPDR